MHFFYCKWSSTLLKVTLHKYAYNVFKIFYTKRHQSVHSRHDTIFHYYTDDVLDEQGNEDNWEIWLDFSDCPELERTSRSCTQEEMDCVAGGSQTYERTFVLLLLFTCGGSFTDSNIASHGNLGIFAEHHGRIPVLRNVLWSCHTFATITKMSNSSTNITR